MQKDMDDEEIELVSKAPALKDTGKLSKEEFDIDIEHEKVVCPEGKVAEKCYQSKDAEGKITKTFFSLKRLVMTVFKEVSVPTPRILEELLQYTLMKNI